MRHLALLLALASQLMAGAPRAIAAESLGRLFFTPDQRASLDTARTKRTRTTVATEEGVGEKPPPPPQPEHVTYRGMVRRSDGKTTVWLNDRAMQDKDLRSGTSVTGRIRPDGSVTVQGAQSGRSVDLKVGQSAELLSGTVEERYARRDAATPKPEVKPAVKPGADASAAKAAAPARSIDERDREDRMENALKALETAATAKPAPAAPLIVYPPPPPSR